MFKNHQIKSNHRVLRKNKEETHGPTVFAPDYTTTGLATKMCTKSNEHSMYIIFLWFNSNIENICRVAEDLVLT
jgi:hypothetical protein